MAALRTCQALGDEQWWLVIRKLGEGLWQQSKSKEGLLLLILGHEESVAGFKSVTLVPEWHRERDREATPAAHPGGKTEDGSGLVRGKKGIGCLGLNTPHMRVTQDD